MPADGGDVDGERADEEDVVVGFYIFWGLPDERVEVVKGDVRKGVFGLQLAEVLGPSGGDGYGTWLFVVDGGTVFPEVVAVAVVTGG